MDSLDFLFQIEADVHRHLIVSAPCGVELLAGGADSLRQDAFDIHMDVFLLDGESNLSFFDFRQDLQEGLFNLGGLFSGQDSLLGQHFSVGDAAGDILLIESLVKLDRGVEFLSG